MRSDPRAETRAMHACDTLFGKIMHVSAQNCDRCLAWGVQVAHIMRRRFWLLRCDAENVRMLCAECHRSVDAGEWRWPELIGQGLYDRLIWAAANEGKKPHDWFRTEKKRLEAEWERVR